MKKILIIEDCHLVRLQIKKVLEESGFSNIVELSSANVISQRPHLYLNDVSLIILDIGLPEISGIDFAKQLRDHPAYCNIPIIFISGHSDYKIVQDAIEAGGIDFIAKPFKHDFLAKRIEKVMETLYGNIKGKKEDNKTKIEEVIINEYDRATRAGKSLSFLLFGVENDYLDEASSIIKENVRKIDSVLVMEDKIFVVLPLTEGKNLTIVINKLQDKLLQNNINLTLEKAVSFEPSSEKTLDDLKKELFGEK
ncbi:MAG: response regulator [Desulfobacterales bacterium]|nr:response regulator [Desulfobacterales bacterium]